MKKKISRKVVLSKLAICVAIMSNVLNISATNAPRSQLEKVYLLNVALYMPERDLTKLSMVNKKSQETLFMMHRTTICGKGVNVPLPDEVREKFYQQQVSILKESGRKTQTLDFRDKFKDYFIVAKYIDEEREKLYRQQASIFKELGRKIQTLDFRGEFNDCLNVAKYAKDIKKEDVTRIALYGIHFLLKYEIHNALKKSGFTNVQNIEMHDALGDFLYTMTFRSKPTITPLNAYSACISDSDIRVHIKSVNITDTEDDKDKSLQETFKDACFYISEFVYHEDFDDEVADSARSIIIVPRRDADEGNWNWDNILKLASTQYEKRLRPAVYIEDQFGFDGLSIEYLKGRELIEQDEDGTITLMKWSGSLNPIAEFPISLKALTLGDYDCENDVKHAVDITGFQPGDPNTPFAIRDAGSLIIRDKGKHYAIYGSYIPKFATTYQSFWDQFFDYSVSEIVISNDVRRGDLSCIPDDIDGHITFLGNRDENEKAEIRNMFTKKRRRYMHSIDVQGINARDNIKEEDLYYSTVQINFPDLKADKVDPDHRAILEHTETECDKKQTPAGEYHSIGTKPTFRYLLKIKKLEHPCNLPIGNLTNSTKNLPTFQLTGVFDDVYTAPNKRLAIHRRVREIDFQPKAGAGLTFVLGTKINYINKEFWQPGNSYLLRAWKDGATLNYLKSIKDEHEIEISDCPDVFGFWNISKKEPFTINRIPVFQMN